ncbi:hypothetical protein PSHT_14717 [Puccinia striiformis]|uniref:Uncharacterized protein n=1 Tax=Puccinia striiformis TaxID=27350 RepID=A0A2S4UIU1_9BASI|nr:hypothetical protein PSHT_14717 [Puccinia striiformis]
MARTPRVSASPRPSPTSRPPSHQSSRIVTPVKSHPNYVRTNNDTRRSLVNSSRMQKTAKKRKIQVVADTDDSDHSSDNSEAIPRPRARQTLTSKFWISPRTLMKKTKKRIINQRSRRLECGCNRF